MKRPLSEEELKSGMVNGRKILKCEEDEKTLKVGRVWNKEEIHSQKIDLENLWDKKCELRRESL